MKRLFWILVSLSLFAAPVSPLDQKQQPFDFDAFIAEGKGYVIVDFAASWCKPCYRALPKLQDFADSHPEFRVLVVSEDEEESGRNKIVSDLGLRLPVIWDNQHQLAERFSPKGFPATYILNASGDVVYQHIGYTAKTWQEFVETAEALD